MQSAELREQDETNRIACIGWGSLIWRPEGLPLQGGWRLRGPLLPVEFARQSENKRITLVLCPGLPRVPTRWTILDVPNIQSAKRVLAAREWVHALQNPHWIEANIGYWERATGESQGMAAASIAAWAETQDLAGVVWTSLPCKFNGVNGTMPSEDEVVESLRCLRGIERDLAEEYVRKAPSEVDTPYRRRIANEFGWK